MLTAGTALDEQFIVTQPPERHAVGARFEVTDGAGCTRTALIAALGAEPWAVSLAESELKTLADAEPLAHLAFAEKVVAAADGTVVEIHARGGLDDAEDYASGLSVQQSPGRVVGMLATRFADLADDLAALHARGEVHGAIDAHAILLDPQATPRLVLALFSRARLVQPPPSTPTDPSLDVRALADAFHALVAASRAPIDPTLAADVGALAEPNSDGSPRTLEALVAALRALASRLGVAPTNAPVFAPTPSAQEAAGGRSAAPAFTTGTSTPAAYRPPPASDPFGGRGPGVHLPVRPDDGRGFRVGARAIGLVLGVVLAVVRIAARSSHPYGGYSSGYNSYGNYYDPSRYGHATEPSDDTSRCEGESIAPVSSAAVPGSGNISRLAAACDGVMIRTAVQRGSDLYLPARSGTTGMEWSELTESDRVASDVDDLSNSAPSESGPPFVAFTSQHATSVGVLALEDNTRPVSIALPGEHADTPPYALGQTARFTYVAAHLVAEGRHTGSLALLRVSNPTPLDDNNGERATEPSTLAIFDLGEYSPLAVVADESLPRLLVAEFDVTRPARIRALTLDLELFDEVTVPARVHGHRHVPAQSVTRSAPLTLARPLAIAAHLGLPTGGFLVGSAATTLDGADACEGQLVDGVCFDTQEVRVAYFPVEGEPTLGPVIVDRGVPLTLFSGIDGDEALVGTGTGSVSRILRVRFDADREIARRGPFDVPHGMPRLDGFVQLACGGHAWMLFAGGSSRGEARVSAVPSSCTSIGIDTSAFSGSRTGSGTTAANDGSGSDSRLVPNAAPTSP
jgi:hypothetical protein